MQLTRMVFLLENTVLSFGCSFRSCQGAFELSMRSRWRWQHVPCLIAGRCTSSLAEPGAIEGSGAEESRQWSDLSRSIGQIGKMMICQAFHEQGLLS